MWLTFLFANGLVAQSNRSAYSASSRRLAPINARLGGLAENTQNSDVFFWNPATLAFTQKTEVTLIGTPIITRQQNEIDYIPIRIANGLSVTVSGNQFNLNSIGGLSATIWRDEWSSQIGNLRQKFNRIGTAVSYGMPFNQRLGIGSTVRFFEFSTRPVETKLKIATTRHLALDLGMHYRQPNFLGLKKTASFDLALMELGNLAKTNLPSTSLNIRLGSIYHLTSRTHLSAYWNLRASASSRIQLGIEQWLFPLPRSQSSINNGKFEVADGYFALRAGLTIPAEKQLTNSSYPYQLGATFQTGNLQSKRNKIMAVLRLEYSYARWLYPSQTYDHWITATISWGRNTEIEMENQQGNVSETNLDFPQRLTQSDQKLVTKPLSILLDFSSRLIASPSIFSPNKDGHSDALTFMFKATSSEVRGNQSSDNWILEIRDQHQRIVQKFTHFEQTNDGYQVVWDGTNLAQNPLIDGKYTAKLVRKNPAGEKLEHSRTVFMIDTVAPNFILSAEPIILVNDALAIEGNAIHRPTLHFKSDDSTIAHWQVKLVANGKEILDQISGYASPPNPVFWDQNKTMPMPSGEPLVAYHCVATLCDLAGNCQTQTIPISVIDLRQVNSRKEKRGVVMSLPGIMFDTDSYHINTETYTKELSEISQAINAYPQAQVVIEGHTDDVGDSNYNLQLSKQRAETVQQYLIDHFQINSDRLLAIGRGEQDPIVPNNSDTNRHKNRRVDIVLLTAGDPIQNKTSLAPNPKTDKKQLLVGEYFTLLVGSFQDERNAKDLVQKLEQLNLSVPIRISTITTAGSRQVWHRVMVGRFYQKPIALDLAETLSQFSTTKPLLILANDD